MTDTDPVGTLQVCLGTLDVYSLHVCHDGLFTPHRQRGSSAREGVISGWSWAAVKTTIKGRRDPMFRAFRVGEEGAVLKHGPLYVRGTFVEVKRETMWSYVQHEWKTWPVWAALSAELPGDINPRDLSVHFNPRGGGFDDAWLIELRSPALPVVRGRSTTAEEARDEFIVGLTEQLAARDGFAL